MLTLKIDNLDKLREFFTKAPAKIAPSLQKATIEAGKQIQRIEVMEAPHDTGTLQRSIKMTYRPIMVEIEPIAGYAGYVVTGTRPHLIYPTRAKALRFMGKDGKYHYAKIVKHTGTRANDFVGRTVVLAQKPVNDLFQKALEDALKLDL